jgi:poly [ADP-ribose] polymerase
MKIASNLINEDTSGSETNVLDHHYNALNCGIKAIDKGSKTWKMVADYVKNTHASTHNYYTLEPLDIYEIERPGEETRYNKSIGNDLLLWHGSGVANFVGILS